MVGTESSSLYNHDRVHNNMPLNHDTESDEEFDDTRIETPRSIRQDISGHNLNSSYVAEQQRDRDQIRSTTTTIPLKDPQIVDNNTETRHTKYRINNGTPMAIRLTTRSGSHNKNDLSAVPSTLPEVQVTARRSFSQYSSPLRKQISRRSIVDSPPSNLKIRPLDLNSSLYSKVTETREQIEKVSSPRSQTGSLSTREPVKRYTNDSMDESTKGDEDTIRKTSLPKKVNAADNQVSPIRLSNDFRSYDFDRDAVSRANLLERVNQTLDSIGNQDVQLEGSPFRNHERSYLRSGTSPRRDEASAKDTGEEDDVSSSSDFDGFIDKLNFKYRETSPVLGNSTPKVDESSPKKLLAGNWHTDNIKEAGEASKDDYGSDIREIFKRDRKQSSKASDHLRYHGETLSGSEEWSSEKWKKLNRVVRLKAISRQEAVNSHTLAQTFGCTSRSELAQRIDFLIKFNKIKEKSSLRVKGKIKKAARKLKIGK